MLENERAQQQVETGPEQIWKELERAGREVEYKGKTDAEAVRPL